MFDCWTEASQFLIKTTSALFEVQMQCEENYRMQVTDNIKDYIMQNIGGDLSLVAIANRTNYNPSYISRLFKRLEHINLSEYIVKARLAKAKELLLNGNMNINEVAAEIGFDSPQYFATVFRKHVGLSPNQYRLDHLT